MIDERERSSGREERWEGSSETMKSYLRSLFFRSISSEDERWVRRSNVHVVMLRVFVVRSVQVESSSSSEIPIFLFSFDSGSSR